MSIPVTHHTGQLESSDPSRLPGAGQHGSGRRTSDLESANEIRIVQAYMEIMHCSETGARAVFAHVQARRPLEFSPAPAGLCSYY